MSTIRYKYTLSARRHLILALEFFSPNDSDIDTRLERLIDTVEPILTETVPNNERAKSSGIHCSFHGNRVLRTVPVKPGGGSVVFRLLLDIVHCHWVAMLDHMLMRGALTLGVGSFKQRSHALVGSGIREAERLSEEVAEMPRVIVDPRLLQAIENDKNLRSEHHTVPEELEWIRSILECDADGIWFVDYLRAIHDEVASSAKYDDRLAAHRAMILDKWNSVTEWDQTWRSLSWLTTYHNRVVSAKKKHALRVPQSYPFAFEFPEE